MSLSTLQYQIIIGHNQREHFEFYLLMSELCQQIEHHLESNPFIPADIIYQVLFSEQIMLLSQLLMGANPDCDVANVGGCGVKT